jgi:hypothetical protein
MAAPGPFIVPNLAKLNLVNATDLLAATAANFRLALVASTWAPADSTDELWSTVSANEIANGNGYTTGGVAPTGIALSQSGGVVTFTFTSATWTASGTGIPAWRYGVLYYLGTLNGKVNPLVAHFLGDSTPADVPLTTSGNPLTITPSGSGVISFT